MKIVAGETAFVTGAASGIGLAMCQVFAEAGMKVAMADIDQKAVIEAAESLTSPGCHGSAARTRCY